MRDPFIPPPTEKEQLEEMYLWDVRVRPRNPDEDKIGTLTAKDCRQRRSANLKKTEYWRWAQQCGQVRQLKRKQKEPI
ncbi:MAG: hypothetical protein UT24_C0015G0045 [Candidatus Woesebacteria bacterium GW2011_GWB1_39_12]|uniref:Uncharacterized protein n=1 Tax=Candidatus Woesebacteria bacterium GW2011_GWB1_39_12 TaxID=1618574 RepID=A0A0G0QEV0_9BACT|nr:MAG: hypothetical protein UT24_C0015G0045 [Candidatus Woesebacteria bacterium GW2011_GWB1_39_12]